MKNNLRIAFFGTPPLTLEILEELKNSNFSPELIVTGPDAPVGRKLILTSPEPKKWAEENNIQIIQPEKITEEFLEKLKKTSWDLFIVVAYGKILPEDLINIPKYGTLNIHYSLLPKYRGATPVESAILNGETKTGVCIQKMVYELDAGPVIALEEVDIDSEETAPELRNRLNQIGKKLLVETLPKYISGEIKPVEQNHIEKTRCGKIKKEDGEIKLTENPEELYRKYRAYHGWPSVFFFVEKNNVRTRVKITEATFQNGEFIPLKVVPEGKKEISYESFSRNLN